MEQKNLEYYLSQIRRIAEHRETDAEEKIKEVYKKLKSDLRHFVADYYADHGEDDRLSFEILNRKRRYARFIEETVKITDDHLPEIREDIEKVVDDTYKITFDGMTDAVKRSVSSDELKENLKGVKAATPEQIRAGVLNDVSGITPEMTYTKDRTTFIYELQKQLNIGLANGDRYTTMAKRIAQRCDIAYRRSLLIARTETHRVREKGFLDSAEEINGILESSSDPISLVKTWNSMEDERVRDTEKANHRVVDGVSVGVDDVFTLKGGVTAKAPGSSGTAYNDCNCRCFLSYEMKSVDKSGGSGIIGVEGANNMTIHSIQKPIENPIEQQHTGKGNPNAIITFGTSLNNRQARLLDKLPDYDSRVTVHKKSVNMADLSALTAQTGHEFAMFAKGNERLIIRGNSYKVEIHPDDAKILASNGYKWSGHTHPGIDFLSMQPSDGDYSILECFKQNNSVIYNSKGDFRTFEKRS